MTLHGDFALISPPGLLQLLSQEQRSARIQGWRGLSTATLDLSEGLVVAARCDDLTGEEAVFRFATWESGRFAVEALPADGEGTFAASCEELLLEGARRRDESESALPALPPALSHQVLATLHSACPALAGLALVGYDGRVLGVSGLAEPLAARAAVLACGLDGLGHGLELRPGVTLYARAGLKLLLADLGDGLLLALPAPGISVGEATSQIAALGPMRAEVATG